MKDSEQIAFNRFRKSKAEIKNAELALKENLYDQVISASYYAILHSARALLAINEIPVKKHAGVMSLFALHFVKTGVIDTEYSKILVTANRLRTSSDYSDYYFATQEEAVEILESAKVFVGKIESILNFQ